MIAKILLYIIVTTAIAVAAVLTAGQLIKQLPQNPYAALGLLALVGVPFLVYHFTRDRKAKERDEETMIGKDRNLMLYPRGKDDIGHDKKTAAWTRDLAQYGFSEAGKYVAYAHEFPLMQRKKIAVDGFANPKESLYAVVHTENGSSSRLEVFTSYADGRFFGCDTGTRNSAIFSRQTPLQQVIPLGELPIMELLDQAAKNRPEGEVFPVAAEKFREVYMRREFDRRTWQDEHQREINRIDMEVREELYRNAPRLLTNPQVIAMNPENFVVIHDELMGYDLFLAAVLAGGPGILLHKRADDPAWGEMTPRELFRHAVSQGWFHKTSFLLSLDSPHPADVYMRNDDD